MNKISIRTIVIMFLFILVITGCGGNGSAGVTQSASENGADATQQTGGNGGAGAMQSASENGADATQQTGVNGGTKEDRLQVVTTIFPVYDWARQVVGAASKDVDVMLLVENGVDMHSFQPTASDLMTIADCDLFLYVGGESDEWVEEALKTAANPDRVTLKLIDVLGDAVLEEEIAEGMEHDHDEHDHNHEHEDDEEHNDDERQLDEHVWLSLKNAQVLTKSISDALSTVDSDNAGTYADNQAAYAEQLKALDTAYQTAIESAAFDTLLFGDRFPFLYLTRDYGLTYYAAFPGCSAETEASFETVTFLADKTDELQLKHLMIIEGSDGRIAQTIIDSTREKSQKILTLDSMQSVTKDDIATGITYLSVMEGNLEVLKEALQ